MKLDIQPEDFENEEDQKPEILSFTTTEIQQAKTIVLARLVASACVELNRRQQEDRDQSLKAALEIWPDLSRALQEKGRRVSLNNFAAPVLTEWADQPVVPLCGHYGPKPRTKRAAEQIALTSGDGGWATIGELWLWVAGGGPIVTRTLQNFGFLPGPVVYGYRDLRKPQA